MTEMIRTFICLDLPSTLKARLEKFEATLQAHSRSRVSWAKPENIHLTLRFLGDIEKTRLPELQACVERAAQGINHFTMSAIGTGAFPNLRNPRVFWIGIKDDHQQLKPLQQRVEKELVAAGFGKEDKPFSPHLTIGRARTSRQSNTRADMRDITTVFSSMEFAEVPFPVEEIIIMRSELRPSGPIYTKLAMIKLTA
jgi:2'-5' RNA ligase